MGAYQCVVEFFSRLHRPSPHIPSYETKLTIRFTCDVVYMFSHDRFFVIVMPIYLTSSNSFSVVACSV